MREINNLDDLFETDIHEIYCDFILSLKKFFKTEIEKVTHLEVYSWLSCGMPNSSKEEEKELITYDLDDLFFRIPNRRSSVVLSFADLCTSKVSLFLAMGEGDNAFQYSHKNNEKLELKNVFSSEIISTICHWLLDGELNEAELKIFDKY